MSINCVHGRISAVESRGVKFILNSAEKQTN